MYPLDIPVWVSVPAVLFFLASAVWTSYKDGFSSVGQAGIVVAGITSLTWFTELPAWTAWVIIALTISLFVVGMLAKDDKDEVWHIAAMAVGLLTKAVCAFSLWFLGIMDGSIELPKWTLFWTVTLVLLVAAAAVFIAVRRLKSPRETNDDDPPAEEGAPSSGQPDTAPPDEEEM